MKVTEDLVVLGVMQVVDCCGGRSHQMRNTANVCK
jgi:hypothetical protein